MPYKDKRKQLEYQRQWMARRREDFLKDKVCIFCGSIERLELDHIDPKLKISHKIWSWSFERRVIEIAKCRVLCHTCHKKRSDEQLKRDTPHGTISGYHYRKCRCNPCRKVAYQYEKGRVKRNGIALVLKTSP